MVLIIKKCMKLLAIFSVLLLCWVVEVEGAIGTHCSLGAIVKQASDDTRSIWVSQEIGLLETNMPVVDCWAYLSKMSRNADPQGRGIMLVDGGLGPTCTNVLSLNAKSSLASALFNCLNQLRSAGLDVDVFCCGRIVVIGVRYSIFVPRKLLIRCVDATKGFPVAAPVVNVFSRGDSLEWMHSIEWVDKEHLEDAHYQMCCILAEIRVLRILDASAAIVHDVETERPIELVVTASGYQTETCTVKRVESGPPFSGVHDIQTVRLRPLPLKSANIGSDLPIPQMK